MKRDTVLCLEDRRSRFVVSREVYASGAYDLVAATSTASAIVALKAMPSILAAVLPFPQNTADQSFQVATELEAVRPGLPKLVVAPAFPLTAELQALHVSYVESLRALARELGLLIAETHKAKALREESVELRDGLRRAREETRRLTQQAFEKLKSPDKER
jgi:hypothetical protein